MNFKLKNMNLTKIEMSLVCLFLFFCLYPILSFYFEPFLYEKILNFISILTFAYIFFAIIIDKNLYLIFSFFTFGMIFSFCNAFMPTEYRDGWALIKNKYNCTIIQKNMRTHEVYWKCNNGIIYVNNHEN